VKQYFCRSSTCLAYRIITVCNNFTQLSKVWCKSVSCHVKIPERVYFDLSYNMHHTRVCLAIPGHSTCRAVCMHIGQGVVYAFSRGCIIKFEYCLSRGFFLHVPLLNSIEQSMIKFNEVSNDGEPKMCNLQIKLDTRKY